MKLPTEKPVTSRLLTPRLRAVIRALHDGADTDPVPASFTRGDMRDVELHFWRMGSWFGASLATLGWAGTGLFTIIVWWGRS